MRVGGKVGGRRKGCDLASGIVSNGAADWSTTDASHGESKCSVVDGRGIHRGAEGGAYGGVDEDVRRYARRIGQRDGRTYEVRGYAGRKVPNVIGGHGDAGEVLSGSRDCGGVLGADRQIGRWGKERGISRVRNSSGDCGSADCGGQSESAGGGNCRRIHDCAEGRSDFLIERNSYRRGGRIGGSYRRGDSVRRGAGREAPNIISKQRIAWDALRGSSHCGRVLRAGRECGRRRKDGGVAGGIVRDRARDGGCAGGGRQRKGSRRRDRGSSHRCIKGRGNFLVERDVGSAIGRNGGSHSGRRRG